MGNKPIFGKVSKLLSRRRVNGMTDRQRKAMFAAMALQEQKSTRKLAKKNIADMQIKPKDLEKIKLQYAKESIQRKIDAILRQHTARKVARRSVREKGYA